MTQVIPSKESDVYRIKELEWEEALVIGEYVAKSLLGKYYATPNICCIGNTRINRCDSIEHGKQLCQEHFEAEMRKGLTSA